MIALHIKNKARILTFSDVWSMKNRIKQKGEKITNPYLYLIIIAFHLAHIVPLK